MRNSKSRYTPLPGDMTYTVSNAMLQVRRPPPCPHWCFSSVSATGVVLRRRGRPGVF